MHGDQLTMDELLGVDPVELVRAALAGLDKQIASIDDYIVVLERDLGRARADRGRVEHRRAAVAASLADLEAAADATIVEPSVEDPTGPGPELDLAPAVQPTRRRGGRPRLVDYAEVARVANEALAAGGSAGTAVAELLGKPAGYARKAIARARADGFTIGPTAPATAPAVGKLSKKEAALARAAVRANCSKCGREFSAAGLGPHQSRCQATPATPAAPAAVPAAVKASKVRKSEVDLDEVARVVLEARDKGVLPIPALQAWSGQSESKVSAWLKRAIARGLIPADRRPVPRVVPDPPARPPKMPPLDTLAAAYKAAVAEGRRPIGTLADRYDAPREIVQEWVERARTAGLLPPRNEPQVPGVLPGERAVPRAAVAR